MKEKDVSREEWVISSACDIKLDDNRSIHVSLSPHLRRISISFYYQRDPAKRTTSVHKFTDLDELVDVPAIFAELEAQAPRLCGTCEKLLRRSEDGMCSDCQEAAAVDDLPDAIHDEHQEEKAA